MGAMAVVKNIDKDGIYVRWLTKKQWEDNGAKKGTAAMNSIGTKLDKATQNLVLDPDAKAAITDGMKAGAGNSKKFKATWYQPKESKDKKFKDKLARFSK